MTAIRSAIRAAIRPAIRSVFGSSAVWTPAELFAASEQGVWYDPSDLTTMFQDSTGTTPVTADGQTVGLILDKSQGLTIGSELVTNGQFGTDTSGWTPTNSTISVDAGRLKINAAATTFPVAKYTFATTVGKSYKFTADFDKGTSNKQPYISPRSGFDVVSATNTGTLTCIFAATATSTTITVGHYATTAATGDSYFDNVSVKEIAGNHAYQATAASRPLYKTSGGLHWLQFDGTDDFLQTAAIDFSATDEMSVFAGARKSSDAAIGYIVDHNTPQSNTCAWAMTCPQTVATSDVSMRSRGSGNNSYATYSSFAAPITGVLTGQAKIATDLCTLRLNGVQQASSTSDQGYGNYSNAILSIGKRPAGNPLNGYIYSLIVRGKVSSAAEISSAESYIAGKSGVTL